MRGVEVGVPRSELARFGGSRRRRPLQVLQYCLGKPNIPSAVGGGGSRRRRPLPSVTILSPQTQYSCRVATAAPYRIILCFACRRFVCIFFLYFRCGRPMVAPTMYNIASANPLFPPALPAFAWFIFINGCMFTHNSHIFCKIL